MLLLFDVGVEALTSDVTGAHDAASCAEDMVRPKDPGSRIRVEQAELERVNRATMMLTKSRFTPKRVLTSARRFPPLRDQFNQHFRHLPL